jgi:DNA-binding CsgD family transcriptional regulator
VTRFLVVERHPADAVAALARELAAGTGDGAARVVAGWRRPAPGVATVCVGRVENDSDAAAAVLCAVSGAALVVDAVAPRSTVDRLCDDLRHLGDLDHRADVPSGPALSGDERALLARLLGGATLGQAAHDLHISRRTADRRLAGARDRLGAQSTSEAVAAAARLGVPPHRPGGSGGSSGSSGSGG